MSLDNITNNDITINEEKSQNDEAEKVEESLRDFIGKIITYYEKYNVNNTILTKYEEKISNAETLLEVFDVMKEMFDELMENVIKNYDLLDCSEISENDKNQESIDKILFKYELEIKNHIKIQKEITLIAENNEKMILNYKKENDKLKKQIDNLINNNDILKKEYKKVNDINYSLKMNNLKLENQIKENKNKNHTNRDKSKNTIEKRDNKKSFDYINSALLKLNTKPKKSKKNYSINRNNTKSFLGNDYINNITKIKKDPYYNMKNGIKNKLIKNKLISKNLAEKYKKKLNKSIENFGLISEIRNK